LMATSEAHRLGRIRYVVRVWQYGMPDIAFSFVCRHDPVLVRTTDPPPPAFLCPALPL
jgi:hypothetical protein